MFRPGAFIVACFASVFIASDASAQFDPATIYRESPAVAARFADPAIEIPTPAFAPGKDDFTTHAEMIAFIDELATISGELRIRAIGTSHEGRLIPLLVFARPASSITGNAINNAKPTVLIIGQLHGDEPAGGEAALALAARLAAGELTPLLDRINVVIVPRANPDGAFHFIRGTKAIADIDRDHLLLSTAEARALARVFVEYAPHVVVDCGEFPVAERWLGKFEGVQSQDAMIHYATVPNLSPQLTAAAETVFREPLLKAFERERLSSTWHYTTATSPDDRRVSMGGVTPDNGRNIAGLRNAISLLVESRGAHIGRAHYKRRVATHLAALTSILESTAQNALQVIALKRDVEREVMGSAGIGAVVVVGAAKETRQTLTLLDPQTGEPKHVDVDWLSALEIEPKLARKRPYGYVLPGSAWRAAHQLRMLGISVYRIAQRTSVESERYVASVNDDAKQDDVRRRDDDDETGIGRSAATLEPHVLQALPGYFYVPLNQPLANLAIAALEPEPRASFAANGLLGMKPGTGRELQLYRLARPLGAQVVLWPAR